MAVRTEKATRGHIKFGNKHKATEKSTSDATFYCKGWAVCIGGNLCLLVLAKEGKFLIHSEEGPGVA